MAVMHLGDRRRKILVSCLLCLFVSLVLGEWGGGVEGFETDSKDSSEPYIDQKTYRTLDGRIYAFFNHNSETWDPERSTYKATRRLTKIVREHDIPVISTVERFEDNEPVDSHFLNEKDITYPVKSSNGEHQLQFPHLKAVILSGGQLNACLSRAFEDIYQGIYPYRNHQNETPEPVRVYLVADAVYLCGSQANVMFDRQQEHQTVNRSAFSFLRGMALMSDDDLADYLEKALKLKGGPHHQDAQAGVFDPEEAHVRILRGDHEIHSVGKGQIRIELILIDTALLKERLPQIVRRAGVTPSAE